MGYRLHRQDYDLLYQDIDNILEPYKDQLNLIIIFGSVARQEAIPESDIDLLIVGNKKEKKSIKNDLAEYSVNQGIGFDLLFYDIKSFNQWKDTKVIQEALKEGITLWKKTK